MTIAGIEGVGQGEIIFRASFPGVAVAPALHHNAVFSLARIDDASYRRYGMRQRTITKLQ